MRGDVRNERLVADLVKDADIVLPLAALVGAPLCDRDPMTAEAVNREAIVMLSRLVGRGQKLVFPTTNSGYGVGADGAPCTENSPLKPVSLYGTTKVAAERAILDSGNGVTLRLATAFGMAPRMRIDLLVNDFTYRACTERVVVVFEGRFRRNFIHIRDIAKAFQHAIAQYDAMNNRPYNVGLSDANMTKLDLCARIKARVAEFVYLEAPVGKDPDKRDYLVSNARMEATGFDPDWSLDAGIAELVKGYRLLRNTRFGIV